MTSHGLQRPCTWVRRVLPWLWLWVAPLALLAGPGIAVDPASRLENPTVLGEWTDPANLEGWKLSHGGELSIKDKILRGTGSTPGAGVVLTLDSIPAGLDLDLGFNDYLQIRLKLPADHAGPVQIEYGTSTRPGFDATRRVVIPSEKIPKDGAFHIYRVDLGLEAPWRDALSQLRVIPLQNGEGIFEVDYIEVGDEPGTAPALNLDTNFKAPLNASNTQRMESKHLCFWWDPENKAITHEHARRALRMCEESYQVYCRKLGFIEPFTKFKQPNSPRYKVNFITWYSGFWAGGHKDRAHLNIGEGGLRDEGWGNPAPHEFAHVVQMAQPGFLAGGHWESHANYLRFKRNSHLEGVIPNLQPGLGNMTAHSNYRPDHKRLIYADQRYYLALDDYGTEFGLPSNYASILWREGEQHRTLIEKLAGSLPRGISVKDVACECLKRWPMLDFAEKSKLRAQMWETPAKRAEHFWKQGALLIPQQDRPGWWRVPLERAPEAWGYMLHELSAPPRATVTAQLRGFDLPGKGEDWRWCFIAVGADDSVRYSPVWAPGAQSFDLTDQDRRVFLLVAATPGSVKLDLEGWSNTQPVDKHPDRLRYAYEVRLVNAVPAFGQYEAGIPAGARPHPKGGGLVSSSAKVAPTAYVGPKARVLGSAQVLDHARVEDEAIIQGRAKIQGKAVVSGRALVEEDAEVADQARIRDRAYLGHRAKVQGRALVAGYSSVVNSTISEDAIVRGCAAPFGGEFRGTAIADHDYSMNWKVRDGVHFDHVPYGEWYGAFYAMSLRKPRGLMASYRTQEPEGEEWWDEFGALHAILRGNPQRIQDPIFQSRVLALDGKDDYVLLDRSLADTPLFSFGCWIRPERMGIEEPILFLGKSANESIKLVREASGKVAILLGAQSFPNRLPSASVFPSNTWRHLSVVLDGTKAKLYVNGKLETTAAMPSTPLEVLAPNDAFSTQANYLGRDWNGALFQGSLNEARFYNVALSDAEIELEAGRNGSLLGTFCVDKPRRFTGTEGGEETGIRNGRERTLAAWVQPQEGADPKSFQALFDAGDERHGGKGSALGIENGQWVAKLDSAGRWATGIPAEQGKWQHVALAFDGVRAVLFLNGKEVAARSYQGPVSDSEAAGKCFRIGYSQRKADADTREYFKGELQAACILDRALNAGEVLKLSRRWKPEGF